MKFIQSIATLVLLVFTIQIACAQTELPKGYKQGSVVLTDNSVQAGYIKDNMAKDASVAFIASAADKKKNYTGSDILSAEIDGNSFICINGDFFKIICKGELCFLQKQSDASGKVSYNGPNAVFSSGTDGRPGDYFLYSAGNNTLKLVSKKNLEEVTTASFNGYTAALDKAKAAGNNIEELKEAVTIYNNRNK